MDFRILGHLEVSNEGQPVRLAGSKQRALLAMLLLHANEPVSVEGANGLGDVGERPAGSACNR